MAFGARTVAIYPVLLCVICPSDCRTNRWIRLGDSVPRDGGNFRHCVDCDCTRIRKTRSANVLALARQTGRDPTPAARRLVPPAATSPIALSLLRLQTPR